MGFFTDQRIETVVIAGAGGFGLEVYDELLRSQRFGGPAIAGYVDDTPGLSLDESLTVPLLGSIHGYSAVAGQAVVVAIGSVRGRQAVLERLWSRSVVTPAYAAESALISPAARLEPGSIVCALGVVARGASLGPGSLVNVHTSIGHGARVGAFSVLSPYAALNGDATLGARCFLGTRATLYPKVQLGDDCIVESHCGVRQSVPGGRAMISHRGSYQVTPLRSL